MPLTIEPRDWTRTVGPETFLCSTNRDYIQLDALNDAFASDLMWWAQRLPLADLDKMVGNSLCFGLYHVRPCATNGSTVKTTTTGAVTEHDCTSCFCSSPSQSSSGGGGPGRVMIGFARVVTDHVTFGYLTDVYVLKEHQRKGLGKWTMQCLNEVLDSMPRLRRFLLLTHNPGAARIYEDHLGARKGPSGGMVLLEKPGAARKVPPPRS